ncbi:MAG: hypothetical protein UT66_C0005G0001 [candidate division CPR2 bacterium GW2011_GWC1_39_9]|uniref:Uncharacterized protein n=1 Tax=candidate division CPR2 bacterium GW2011_GWC2_39_10 TaxID=1618345 RepID=A0A0G0Q0B7_UNCC2|nr:MAG: hypothetical protein UT18_C0004G0053 [candidate division CPR2 bacterium GW2011_GWC2_39_10]KKR28224.1 MAG: hypothetical protein UT59_C0032G0009 [candidate division CPR2 bacterium GW2011_GWD1_39_7]KKR35965.1 MAG: hypothetical protein UT66_C0005G0001 [candidate division CPR2 bacterium GW2011_GWC1_39_9]
MFLNRLIAGVNRQKKNSKYLDSLRVLGIEPLQFKSNCILYFFVSRTLTKHPATVGFLESLILAQDERWRRA